MEARWMLGDGAARGATPSALAKSTPPPVPLFPLRLDPLPPLGCSSHFFFFFFPLSSSFSHFLSPLSYSAFHFSTTFCLFPPSFFTTVLPSLCVFICLSVGGSASFFLFFFCALLVGPLSNFWDFARDSRTSGTLDLSIVRRGNAQGELILLLVRRIGCCNDVCLRNGIFMVGGSFGERERERII